MLDPQSAILVKGGNTFLRRDKICVNLTWVVFEKTKSTMACLAAPSFHEGKGSAACAMVAVKATTLTSAAASRFCLARRSVAKAGVGVVFIGLRLGKGRVSGVGGVNYVSWFVDGGFFVEGGAMRVRCDLPL